MEEGGHGGEGFSEETVSTILYVPFEQNLTRRRLRRKGEEVNPRNSIFYITGIRVKMVRKSNRGSRIVKKKKKD